MFNLLKNVIGYTGSSNIDTYIFYAACALVVVLTVIFIDLIFQIFRSFLPHRNK